MEIIEEDRRSADGFVPIAYAETHQEAVLIRGLLREEGGIPSLVRQAGYGGRGASTLARSPSRVYVRPQDAAGARELLGEILMEEPEEEVIPESVNAGYLPKSADRRPLGHTPLSGFARAWIAVLSVVAAAVLVLVVLH
ncbi:MAG: hypothetical protein JST53_15470 [Actinobacteria bacterium]|nr:hypothetical protein [Actinomycetota bacterium]